jgi:hypothetical protein
MPLQIWDKAPLIHNTQSFIEHLAQVRGTRLPLVSRSIHRR